MFFIAPMKSLFEIKNRILLIALVLAAPGGQLRSYAEEIAPAGKHLVEVLEGMHVDKLWLAGKRVNWRTGEATGTYDQKLASHTHCSAFAAAAAEKLGIYLLHPPEHSAVLLANAQQEWLRGSGTNQGWRFVDSPLAAQRLANQGALVVVTCKNPDPKLPGHIAIIRPSTKSDADIVAEGPQIMQAGRHNYLSTNAKEGFKNHAGAFEKNELLYFAHAVPAQAQAQLEGQ